MGVKYNTFVRFYSIFSFLSFPFLFLPSFHSLYTQTKMAVAAIFNFVKIVLHMNCSIDVHHFLLLGNPCYALSNSADKCDIWTETKMAVATILDIEKHVSFEPL